MVDFDSCSTLSHLFGISELVLIASTWSLQPMVGCEYKKLKIRINGKKEWKKKEINDAINLVTVVFQKAKGGDTKVLCINEKAPIQLNTSTTLESRTND